MALHQLQATFSRGVLAKRLQARADTEMYRMSLRDARNYWVMRHGGLRKRPGTVFIGESKNKIDKVTLIPFEFSIEQAYILAFENQLVRVYTSAGPVMNGATQVEFAVPYSAQEASELHYVQSRDTLYLAHKRHRPIKITRTSDLVWAVAEIDFIDGPYLKEEPKGTRLSISGTGNAIPVMTSNTTPSGTTDASDNAVIAYLAADGDQNTSWGLGNSSSSNTVGWWSYTLPAPKVIVGYTLQATNEPGRMPVNWTLSGWDGTQWIQIDIRSAVGIWQIAEIRHYEIENDTAYSAYRFDVSGVQPTVDQWMRIAEIRLFEDPASAPALTLTASSVAGINAGQGFLASDIDRPIRLYTTDGQWNWFRVTARVSATVVQGKLYGGALNKPQVFSRWRLGSWSLTSGYPARNRFFSERLFWARTDSEPEKAWGSTTFGFEEHKVSQPLVDDDAVSLQMLSGQLEEIQWLAELDDLMVGTKSTLRSIGVQDITNGFSAKNAKQKRHKKHGFSNVQPVELDGAIVAADYYRRILREITLVDAASYSAADISIVSDHLFAKGIEQLAYQATPDSIVWSRIGDGSITSTTYEKDQQILGSMPHEIAGGFVESIATKPGPNQTEVWFAVRRTINGDETRYIERFALLEEDHSEADGVYLDSAITYSGTPRRDFTGALHLRTETVQVFADGKRLADVKVKLDGSFQISHNASKVVVGFLFEAYGETLRFAYQGQDGSLLGRRVMPNRTWIDVMNTPMMRVGSPLEMGEAFVREPGSLLDSAVKAKTGTFSLEISASWFKEGIVRFESNQPFASFVRALNIDFNPEP